jgi:hypothetical protein
MNDMITLLKTELEEPVDESGEVKFKMNESALPKFANVYSIFTKNKHKIDKDTTGYFSIIDQSNICFTIEKKQAGSTMYYCAKNTTINDFNELFKNGNNVFEFTNNGVSVDRNPIPVKITFIDTVSSQRGGSRKTTRKFRKGKKKSSRKMKTKGRK